MMYRQITREERYTLAVLRQAGLSAAAIARALGRHRSTIGREVRRNRAASDASYRPQLADWYARGRRSRSRRNRRFGPAAWGRIQALLREDWSPEQVAGWLRRHGELGISHETIYRFYLGGPARGRDALSAPARRPEAPAQALWGYDSRGRLAGKRPITARPAVVETRATIGPWEGDTVLGAGQAGPCVMSLVERKTGYLVLGKLQRRATADVTARTIQLRRGQPRASTSPRRTTPGNGAPTRTPTGCCGSICPNGAA